MAYRAVQANPGGSTDRAGRPWGPGEPRDEPALLPLHEDVRREISDSDGVEAGCVQATIEATNNAGTVQGPSLVFLMGVLLSRSAGSRLRRYCIGASPEEEPPTNQDLRLRARLKKVCKKRPGESVFRGEGRTPRYAAGAMRAEADAGPDPAREQEQERDRAALARHLNGDERAFEDVVRRYEARIRNFAYGFVRDRAAAEDIAQETFLAAYRKAKSYRGEGSFRSWLYRIAIRRAQDELRRRRRRLDVPLEAAGIDARATEPHLGQEAGWDVARALGAMKPEHRTALVLREVEGLSYREMAEVLGWSMANVQTRIHRARLELRAIVEKGRFAR